MSIEHQITRHTRRQIRRYHEIADSLGKIKGAECASQERAEGQLKALTLARDGD